MIETHDTTIDRKVDRMIGEVNFKLNQLTNLLYQKQAIRQIIREAGEHLENMQIVRIDSTSEGIIIRVR